MAPSRFILGELATFPGCDPGGPDEETASIAPALAQLNRRGWLTTFSQPGLIDDALAAQRACVEGFAPDALAQAIAARGLHSDLIVLSVPPGERSEAALPITTIDGRVHSHAGGYSPDFSDFEAACGREAALILRSKWWVCAIDPQWGREDYLWDVLLAPPRPGFDYVMDPNL